MIVIIINPAAGNGYAKSTGIEISNYLSKRLIKHRLCFTEYKGHGKVLAEEAVQNKDELLLCVGGDGTAFEVSSALINSDTALGIIPAGTGNDFIKTINTPSTPIESLELILNSEPKKIDVGKANEHIFLNICGCGIDTDVIKYSEIAKKYFKGIIPYIWGLIKAISKYEPKHLKINIDYEIELSGKFLLCAVANGRYYGGGIAISPYSDFNDSYFDVMIVDNMPKLLIPFCLYGVMRKRIFRFKACKYFRAKNVTIETLDKTEISINEDGEIYKEIKVNFEIKPDAIKIFY